MPVRDVRDKAQGVITIERGYDYLVQSAVGTRMEIAWAVWGDRSFEIKVTGVSFKWGFIPNPFNSNWMTAEKNWHKRMFGLDGKHHILTFYLYVRARRTTRIRTTQRFTGKGGLPEIKF